MSVTEWFDEFCESIRIRNADSIVRRAKAITRCLNAEYWDTPSATSHSLPIGSYGRNTAVHGFTNLDMIFQLPYLLFEKYQQYWGNGYAALLEGVCSSVKKVFRQANTEQDGQFILVPFEDHIIFRLLPAFVNEDGSFRYCDLNDDRRWKAMDPRSENQAMRDRNKECNGNLFPLCRMMRVWKDAWDIPMDGLLIDTLAYQFIGGWEYKDKSHRYYDFMCRDFFKNMADQDENQRSWEVPGSGRRVYDKGMFRYKARRCYYIAADAIRYETDKKEWPAKQKWKRVFGFAFPA
jgi:hypothetical protein